MSSQTQIATEAPVPYSRMPAGIVITVHASDPADRAWARAKIAAAARSGRVIPIETGYPDSAMRFLLTHERDLVFVKLTLDPVDHLFNEGILRVYHAGCADAQEQPYHVFRRQSNSSTPHPAQTADVIPFCPRS